MGLEGGLIQSGDPSVQLTEAIHRFRKLLGDVRQQIVEAVVQSKVSSGHRDARTELRTEIELLAADTQLPHQFDERSALDPFGHPVGQGVQTYVVFSLTAGVERIQPSRGIMPLQY